MITDITDDTFEEFLATSELTLVDFWADWCPHCIKMTPILEETAKELPNVAIAKIDTDEHRETAKRLSVYVLPTFLIFKNGEEICRLSGSYDKDTFLDMIKEAI